MIAFCILLGVLSLCLGIWGDAFNFGLAFFYWRNAQRLRQQRQISPVVLAPILFNGFGLMIVFLMLRLPLAWFFVALVGVTLVHVASVFTVGRYLRPTKE